MTKLVGVLTKNNNRKIATLGPCQELAFQTVLNSKMHLNMRKLPAIV